MESIVERGLVLRRTRHLDDDLRLTLLLKNSGKIFAISKGAMRLSSKTKAIQEPFVEADFQVFIPSHGINGRLGSGRLIRSHETIRANFEAFTVACRCSETIEMLLPFRAPSADVFDILLATLQSLESTKDSSMSPLREWVLFVVRILKSMGHGDVSQMALKHLSEAPLEKCISFVEDELERILPWPLKSTIEV